MNNTTSTGHIRARNLAREIKRLEDKARHSGLSRLEVTRLTNLRRAQA